MRWNPSMQLGDDLDDDMKQELAFAKQELVKSEMLKRQKSAQMTTYLMIAAAIAGIVYLVKRK